MKPLKKSIYISQLIVSNFSKLNYSYFLSLGAIILFTTCSKDKHTEVENKDEITIEVANLNDDEFDLTGDIINSKMKPVTEYGFVYDYDGSDPQLSSDIKIIIGNPGNPNLISRGKFYGKWDVSMPDINHAICAYVIIDGQVCYSKTFRYQSPPRGIWKKLSDFPGTQRSFAFSFTVNGKGYVCCGWDDIGPLKDCWEYDPAIDKWTRLNDFPGEARSAGFCFVIGDKAYMGGGTSLKPDQPTSYAYKDFYSFDPLTKIWKRLSDYPTTQYSSMTGIYGTYHFAYNGFGYVGGGRVGYQELGHAVYRYDPLANSWSAYSIGPKDRYGEIYSMVYSSCFILTDTVFVGTGLTANQGDEATDNFFRFNINNKTWEYFGPVPGGGRAYNFGTANSSLGFFGFDYQIGNFWEYKYSTTSPNWKPTSKNPDSYLQKSCICFTIGNKTYIGLGTGYDFFNKASMYEFTPTR